MRQTSTAEVRSNSWRLRLHAFCDVVSSSASQRVESNIGSVSALISHDEVLFACILHLLTRWGISSSSLAHRVQHGTLLPPSVPTCSRPCAPCGRRGIGAGEQDFQYTRQGHVQVRTKTSNNFVMSGLSHSGGWLHARGERRLERSVV